MKKFFSLFFISGVFLFIFACGCTHKTGFSGDKAFGHVKRIVSFGSRIPDSAGSKAARGYIAGELEKLKVEVTLQNFEAVTPVGELAMANVVGRIRPKEKGGVEKKIIIVGTHYDTKYFENLPDFVGANDGGSGVGVLLGLAELLLKKSLKSEIWLCFFDGEESFMKKSADDWFYGSKFFVAKLGKEGKTSLVKAMILLDMVGDKDFKVNCDINSTASLVKKATEIAKRLGYGRYFFGAKMAIRDDHTPFLEAGIPAIDIIDFEYGGDYSPGLYWHTSEDTLDKVSPKTLKIVGDVTLTLILELDKGA